MLQFNGKLYTSSASAFAQVFVDSDLSNRPELLKSVAELNKAVEEHNKNVKKGQKLMDKIHLILDR